MLGASPAFFKIPITVRAGSDRDQRVSSDLETLCAKGYIRVHGTTIQERRGGGGIPAQKEGKSYPPFYVKPVYIHRNRE